MICTYCPDEPDSVCERYYLCERLNEFRQIAYGKNYAGKEKLRRYKAGEIEIEVINSLYKRNHQQR